MEHTKQTVYHMPEPPPERTMTLWVWLQRNLFASPMHTLWTVLALYVMAITLPPILSWILWDADWVGSNREACSGEGACWVFIKVRFSQFIYGLYPEAEQWRVNLAFLLLIVSAAPLFVDKTPKKRWIVIYLLTLYPLIAHGLFMGGKWGLSLVETSLWGGLMLTLIIAGIGIVAALPLGILLALGRQSQMPIIKSIAVVFIELWRGVPLITMLFMASVMIPMFLPEGVNFNKLVRALIGVTLFQGAYMAEVVRGGLQAIPKGQYEAAASLGLGYWRTMLWIILPQALKMVIPGIVNTFIALFKDTSLVVIIGLFDLLGIVQASQGDSKWLGFSTEGYVFAGLIFWSFCFAISRYSLHIEQKLKTDH